MPVCPSPSTQGLGLNRVIPDHSQMAKDNVNLEEKILHCEEDCKGKAGADARQQKWLPVMPLSPELVSELRECTDPRQTTEATNYTKKHIRKNKSIVLIQSSTHMILEDQHEKNVHREI